MADRPQPTAPSRPAPHARGAAWIALGVYFVLALVYFLPAFLPDHHIFGTDYLAGSFFVHEFISERLAAGAIPKWIPYLFGGVPMFANPGSTYYPFRVLVDVLLAPERIFPALYVIQLTLAGFGMYLLARELGARVWVAGLAGLAFEFTGILTSAVYAGHEGRMIVASFAPLFFFFLHRGIRTGGVPAFAGAAAVLGTSLLSFQIQSNYYLLVAGALWAVFALVHHDVHRDARALARRVALGLAAVGFGFLLASVNFLPFLDYVPESPRGAEGGRGYEYAVSFSMPPAEVSGLAVPEAAGVLEHYQGENPFKLHTEYVGATVLVLLALGLALSRRDRRWWFFLGLTLFTLTIAFGGYTPLYRLYYELLPGTTRFRAPSISFFLVSFSLVVMAALALEALARRKEAAAPVGGRGARAVAAEPEWLRHAVWAITAVAGVSILLAAGVAAAAGPAPRDAARAAGFLRLAFFAGLSALVLWLWLRDRVRATTVGVLLALLLTADLWIVGRRFLETVPPPEYMFAPDDVAAFLARQPRPFRVWNVPFGAPYRAGGNYLMRFDIDQAGGEHGNHLQRYGEYVGAGERTYIDWHNFIEHPQFLHAANVRYLITTGPLDVPFLREVHRGSALVYENTQALPRAYLVAEAVVAPAPDGALAVMQSPEWDPRRQAVLYEAPAAELAGGAPQGGAEVVDAVPDRVVIRASTDRAALLVLSDNDYEGWGVAVNRVPQEPLRANHTFRAVALPAGEHEVVWTFEPEGLRLGFWIYVAGFGLLALYGAALLLRAGRRGRAAPGAPGEG